MHLHLNLLGPFRQGDQPLTSFDYMRLQHLLAYLALYRAVPILRQQPALLFWLAHELYEIFGIQQKLCDAAAPATNDEL